MTRAPSRRFALLAALLLALSGIATVVVTHPAQAATSTSINVNGTSSGRVFDGVGAISGGGGNSRLLADYPAAQQSQVLDYMFKPGYGANLQILKLEIGGDTNSTDGAEASHEHTKGTIDCNQGYEWWLAQQALARNPKIKLYGLSWGAPNWVGEGSNTFFTNSSITYLLDWLGCAKQHKLNISYLGGWNERDYTKAWYENLRSALDSHGYSSIKVVAADSGWGIVNDLVKDPAFNKAVDIVGVHYPCGYGSAFTSCQTSSAAQGLKKPLWASENGSESADGTSTWGAMPVARALNRDYIDGQMTSYINWPLISALYPNLFFSDQGLGIANQPWSGDYHIGKTTWVIAQTAQFTAPDWRYLDSGKGYLAGSGSYVTLRSSASDYSTVIETMDAGAAQTVNVGVTGGMSTGTVHVWATNVRSSDPSTYFKHVQDITPKGGSYSLTVQPGYVYTLTTTSTVPGTSTPQGKGIATPPASGHMALPYSDSFQTAGTTTSPKYFSDMNGAFEIQPCSGRSGNCLQQMTPAAPVHWTNEVYKDPYTIMGDGSWTDYTVSTAVNFRQSGSVELIGRAGQQGRNDNGLNAYHLRVADNGSWSILKSDQSWTFTQLAHGTTTALGTNKWHTVAFTLKGSTLTASVDGRTLGSATDSSYTAGQAGLGVVGYQLDQFSDFSLTPGNGGGGGGATGPVKSGISGKCLDDNGGSSTNGTKADIWDCNGSTAQTWTYTNQTLTINGKCLDVTGQGTADRTPVEIWDCNGGSNQQWAPGANGSLVSVQSGKCLDDPGTSSTNGTQLVINTCNSATSQKWTLP